MTDNIFDETNVEPKFEDLVGDGKKYTDQNAVAKAVVEKDRFIARLLEEKRQLEADFREKTNTQAFEDRMKALEAAQLAERREPPQREATPAPTTPPPDIEDVVQKAIADREAANARSRNLLSVKDKLTEVYGAEYPNRVKARAAELNISMEQLNTLAATTPSAFYAVLGLDAPRTVDNVAPPATRQNSAAFTPETSKKNNAYYQNLRKTNPAVYWTPAIQNEEYNELKRQGPEQFGL